MEPAKFIADFDKYCEELLYEGENELKSCQGVNTRWWVINHILQLHHLMQQRKDELLRQYHDLSSQNLGFVIYSRLNEYKHRESFRRLLSAVQD